VFLRTTAAWAGQCEIRQGHGAPHTLGHQISTGTTEELGPHLRKECNLAGRWKSTVPLLKRASSSTVLPNVDEHMCASWLQKLLHRGTRALRRQRHRHNDIVTLSYQGLSLLTGEV
jgi:hypothetical protein